MAKGKIKEQIQFLRAFAIVCVIMIHSMSVGVDQIFIRPLINVAVPIFIFLSGVLTKIDEDSWVDFVKRRTWRVVIPYVVWTVVYSLCYGYGVIGIFKNLILANAAVQLYYIFVYIGLVFATPFLSLLIKSRYRWIGWLFAPLSIFLFKYIPFFAEIEINKYVLTAWGLTPLAWLSYYYLGLLLGNKIVEIKMSTTILVCLYFLSLVLQVLDGYIFYLYGIRNCGSAVKLSCLLTSSVFLILSYRYIERPLNYRNKITSMLMLVGNYSFGIYLCHMFVKRSLFFIFPCLKDFPFLINSFLVLVFSIFFVCVGRFVFGNKIGRLLGFY